MIRRLAGLLAGLLLVEPAAAQVVCNAVTRLELQQTGSLELQGFLADLGITNTLTTDALTGVRVDLEFRDETGAIVPGRFVTQVKQLSGVTSVDGQGVIAPNATGQVTWLLVPARGAGGTTPAGVRYTARAIVRYAIQGRPFTTPTWDVKFTVQPQPSLVITEGFRGTVEANKPFILFVRAFNAGAGLATALNLTSVVPKVQDPFGGQALPFEILASSVQGIPGDKSLVLAFGNLAPGATVVGEWTLQTTAPGTLTVADAKFKHTGPGGALTSPVERVEVDNLVARVLLNPTAFDRVADYIVDRNRDGEPDGLVTSEGPDLDLTVASGTAAALPPGVASTTVLAPSTSGWLLVRLADPAGGTAAVVEVTRADGKHVDLRNVFVDDAQRLNLLDFAPDTMTVRSYVVAYDPLRFDRQPPRTTLLVGAPRFGTDPVVISSTTALTFAAADDLSGVATTFIQVASGPAVALAGPLFLTTEGIQPLGFFSADRAGNRESTQTVTVEVSTTPPVVAMSSPVAGAEVSGLLDVRGTVRTAHPDKFTLEVVAVNGSTQVVAVSTRAVVEGGLGTWDTRGTPDGPATLRLTARDVLGRAVSTTTAVLVRNAGPPAITDLRAAPAPGTGVAGLVWTAPGDVGGAGAAASYEGRLATGPIVFETDWAAATILTALPTPQGAGQGETAVVTGLTPGTTVYFAIRARDTRGRLAGLSNSPGLRLPSTAPETTLAVRGPSLVLADGTTVLSLGSTVQLTAAPAPVTITYRLDAGATVTASSPVEFTVAEGTQSLTFFSAAADGGREVSRTIRLVGDGRAPGVDVFTCPRVMGPAGSFFVVSSGTVIVGAVDRGPVLFADNFDTALPGSVPDGWTIAAGSWTATEGEFRSAVGGAAVNESLAVALVDSFTDYRLEARVRTEFTSEPFARTVPAGLIFRMRTVPGPRGQVDGYRFTVGPARGALVRFAGGTGVVLATGSVAGIFVPGESVTAAVELSSGVIRGYLNDVLILSTTDTTYLTGHVGLVMGPTLEEGGAAARWDDVRVTALPTAGVASFAVGVDGAAPAAVANPASLTLTGEGSHIITAQAVDRLGQGATASRMILVDGTPPPPVGGIQQVDGRLGAIEVIWQPSVDSGAGLARYEVWRATGLHLSDFASVASLFVVTTQTVFLDLGTGTTAQHGEALTYQIRPVDQVGNVQTGGAVFTADRDALGPAVVTDLTARFRGPEPGDLTLTWTSPGDDGTVGRLDGGTVEIHLSSSLPVASTVIGFTTSVAPGTAMRVVVTGLAEGVTHYVAVRTIDASENPAPLSEPTSARYVVARSTDNRVTLMSDNGALGATTVSTTTQTNLGQLALAGSGLVTVGNLYDIQPDTATFTPPLVVTVVYSTPLPAGTTEADLALYQFSTASATWVRVPDQTLDMVNKRVIGRMTVLTSVVGVFGIDRIPPRVALLSPDPAASGAGRVLNGTQAVVGSVADDRRLARWRVEVATGVNATGGFTTILAGTAPVDAAGLGTWNTAPTPGWVTLRLTATDTAGNAASTAAVVFVGDPSLVQTLGPPVPELVEDRKPERLEHPEAVTMGPDGTRWVADTGGDRVLAFRADGTLRLVIGEVDKDLSVASSVAVVSFRLKEPGGIAALPDGGAVIADTGQHRLVVVSSTGGVRQVLGRVSRRDGVLAALPGSQPGEFNHPRGVDVDAAGNLYVADTENHRWQVLSATGTPLLTVNMPNQPAMDDGDEANGKETGELESAEPIGIARERTGTRVYVSERESGQVFVYTLDDGIRPSSATLAGTVGGGPGTFKTPWHLAATAQGQVYVAERNANRVRRFDKFGAEVLAFGVGPEEAGGQEAAPTRLFKPTGVAVGPGGELAVASRNDDRVKVYDAPATAPVVGAASSPPKAAPRSAPDLSALGPPHDFVLGPNPARAGASVNVYFVTGWSSFETDCRIYTLSGEKVCDGESGADLRARAVAWGSPAYAPGRYAVSWSGANLSGQSVASGVYLIQVKVRNPETGEVVPTLKKVLVIR